MRPLVILKQANENNNFEFTKEELENLIVEIYERGYEDGKGDRRNQPVLPQSQYDKPEEGIYYRGFGLGNGPKDAYGNPVPYCSTDTLPYMDADGNYHPGSSRISSAGTNLNIKAFQ